MKKILQSEAAAIAEKTVARRRRLHAFAECGFDLKRTRDYVEEELRQMGYEPQRCGTCGVIADIGDGAACLLLRADMDALPVFEEAALPFAAKNGAMHACGHDMHTAMLLSAAELLMRYKDRLSCRVRLMFQPAEELLLGAEDMIRDGVLENPRVTAALMLHVMPALPLSVGSIVLPPAGISAPFADMFSVTVTGKGAHGATPEKGIDALSAAAAIILASHEVIAREVAPSEMAALTFGELHGAGAKNAIADRVRLGGSIRSFDGKLQAYLRRRLSEIAAHTAAAYRAEAETHFDGGAPAFWNDAALLCRVKDWATALLGEERVVSYETLVRYGRENGNVPPTTDTVAHGNICSGAPTDAVAHENTRSDAPTDTVAHGNICSDAPTDTVAHENTRSDAPTHATSARPSLGGSEDFAAVAARVPAVILMLAAGQPRDGHMHSLHHPKATFDEAAMTNGVALLAYIAVCYGKDSDAQ